MNISAFWKKDGFVGLAVAVLFLFIGGSELLQSLERKAYDLGMTAASREPSDKVAVIAIDDQSIANLGRWPWPREIHARMIDLLTQGGAKVIGHTALFFEPQIDPGLEYINRLAALLDPPAGDAQIMPPGTESAVVPEPPPVQALLAEARVRLNNDQRLADSLSASGRVMLGSYFELGAAQGRPDGALPTCMQRSGLVDVQSGAGVMPPVPARAAWFPIPLLCDRTLAVGHLNSLPDVDGAVRTEPLVLGYYDQYYPSMSLLLAAASLNLGPNDIRVRLGDGVSMGQLRVPTDPDLQMHTFFYQGAEGQAFPVDSFFDVYSGKIPAAKYRDKIVLIGATAAGVGAPQVTPVSAAMAPVESLAHAVSSILQGHAFTVPEWAPLAEAGAFALVTLYLVLLLPRLGAAVGAIVTLSLLLLLLSGAFFFLISQSMWLKLMVPAALLLTGHALMTTKHYLLAERGKQRSDVESAESNRMLGLAFQGQGQLDIAFDKFRKVPVDDSLMEVLYNLGLDYERKRQFNKAESVFSYMTDYNPKFRDLEQRMSQVRAMSETVILGAGGGTRGNASTLVLDKAGVSKPMLGRYEVEKELGKGAMGVVYLGKDPKIGRVVAIKTMALSQEFEPDELEDVKERFFREAETAGRLNHPNIVSIYDAGEEHDLAYIAMEFLKGKDLMPHTKPDKLLPLAQVLSIVARVAEALDYAHKQNVVHRDIKPANIMYDPETDTPKVTDFGIARITDSSKTKTGMVLGTPSYMSPEQLAGKKIGGSSDLFSLGVSLYQLACGKLPFEGDSMAQLMYHIANDPHADILEHHPELPVCLGEIVDKALAKQVENRYASGAEMAEALRRCAATLRE